MLPLPQCLCLLCCRLRQLISPGSRRSTLICSWSSASPEPSQTDPRPFSCAIDPLPGTSPPRGHLFSPSGPEQKSMDKCIQESIKARFICHLSSPAGAGFFIVKKKDGSLHPCIDYRGLNDITVKNRHPLPLMSSAFELLQGAKVFTKSELCNAYHLVRIHEGDEWKTDVNTPTGHYEYLVLTFGLTNALAVFQGMVNRMLGDMINQFVFVYLDDVLIYSPSLKVHTQHVCQVLKRLLQNLLYVKLEKSELHTKSVSFLGFIFQLGRLSRIRPRSRQSLSGQSPTLGRLCNVSWASPTSTCDSIETLAR